VIHPQESPNQATARREREREQRRAEILSAAERIFAAKGFHESSVESIAEAAGFASGTIYLYFQDKEALYMAVFIAKLTQLIDYVETRSRSVSQPVEALRCAIGAQLEFHDQHRAFFQIFSRERPPVSSGKGEEWKQVHDCFGRHTGLLRSLIEAAQKRKLLRKGDSHRMALMLLGMLIHVTRDLIERSGPEPMAEQAEFVADFFLHGAAVERRAA